MKRVFGVDQLALERRLVAEYGNGQLRADTSLFERLSVTSNRTVGKCQGVPDVLQGVRKAATLIICFDRGPQNLSCAVWHLAPQSSSAYRRA